MCEILDVPRSTYYQSLNKTISNRERENNKLIQRIITINQDSKQRYGAPKIHHLLVEERSEEHTSELQSRGHLVCRLLLEKKNTNLIYLVCVLIYFILWMMSIFFRLCYILHDRLALLLSCHFFPTFVPYHHRRFLSVFFTNPTPTETYTLSLHDALPI